MQIQSFLNKNTFYSLIFVILIFSIMMYANHRSKKVITKECLVARQKKINGVIQNAYFDNDINVKAFVILFTNGGEYINPVFLKGLNGYVIEGDSINKKSGTFDFEIYKKDNSQPIIFTDTVDCNKLN